MIGRDTRENVHARHAIHRGVHVFVVGSDGRLLIQLRSRAKRDYPGCLDVSVGGQVSSGETYEQAAARELMEELGCHDGPLEAIAAYDAFSARQREKRRVFVHRCDGPFRPAPDELDAVAFMTPTQVERALSAKPVTEGLKRTFALFRAWSSGAGPVSAPSPRT